MSKSMTAIFVIFLIFVLLGGAFATYYFFLKDKQVEEPVITNRDIFLRITDEGTGDQIQSGFVIYLTSTGEVYREGKTLKEGRLRISVPVNTSFYLITYNLEDQEYYSAVWKDKREMIFEDRDINLIVKPYGSFSIEQQGKFNVDENLVVFVEKQGHVSRVKPCVRWSNHIISVRLSGMGRSEIPSRLDGKIDKCYDSIDISQNLSEPTRLELDYDVYGKIDEDDFIKIYLIDEDFRYWGLATGDGYVAEDEEGNDIGIPDLVYQLARE